MFTPAKHPRQLRSFNYNIPFVPGVNTKVGIKAFSVAAQTLWGYFPVSVKSVGNIATFRRKIKPTSLHLLILHW